MIILGIETSCDETALSILETQRNADTTEFKVRSNAVLSQIKLHAQYGGVFPMMAKREHAKNLVPLLESTLSSVFASVKRTTIRNTEELKKLLEKEPELLEKLLEAQLLGINPGIDAIAVTEGPGLEPALWVGINFAKALGMLWNVPVLPINHMEGHIVASLINESSHEKFEALNSLEFPALSLLISGGHTELVLVRDFHNYQVIGATKDDAIGEAFDKVARILGLPYPGGPEISRLAHKARELKIERTIKLPRPMMNSGDLNFSFSGIKTAVLYTAQKMGEITDAQKMEIAVEFEDAVTEVLVAKTKKAIKENGVATLIIGGGVIANTHIRTAFEELAAQMNIKLLLPHTSLSTDNALMIAVAGALQLSNGAEHKREIKASGNMQLGK